MIIDTHAHLDFPDFKDDLDDVIKRAGEVGVEYIINVGTSVDTSIKSLELAKKYDHIYASVGIHPNAASNVSSDDWSRIEALAEESKVVAIGETGLDYYRDLSPREAQRRVFREQLRVALEADLPALVHDREAHADTLQIIEEAAAGQGAASCRGVLHAFSGSYSMACGAIDVGWYISIAGPVTYPNAKGLRSLVSRLPLNRILVETDCPSLAPQPRRGKRNEPAYVRWVVEQIAEAKGLSFDDVAEVTTRNARTLFGLPEPNTEAR